MIESSLIFDDNKLFLETKEREHIRLKALVIYNYHFKNIDLIDNQYLIKYKKLNGLKFSRFPLCFNLKLSIISGEIRLSLYEYKHEYEIIDGIIDPNDQICIDDYLIINNTWYPFGNNELQSIYDFLSKYGIRNLGKINIVF